jgi:hypothetical protein
VPIAGKNAEQLDPEKARKFVNDADKIVEWIEWLLPDGCFREDIGDCG